jgi:hypothetical protein
VIDDYTVQHEYGSDSTHGRKPPALKLEGDTTRAVKVGQAVQLVAIATDENPPPQRGRSAVPRASDSDTSSTEPPPQRGRGAPAGPRQVGPGAVGGDSIRGSATGLRFAWLVYRGAGAVKFDPPMAFKVWEDQRGGSPWAPGWQPPPVPAGNKWVYNVTFPAPGTYVLRALAHNGSKFAYENVIFTVTP